LPGGGHGVAFQHLRGNGVLAFVLLQPIPRLGVDFHGVQVFAALLPFGQVLAGRRHVLALQHSRVERPQLPLAGVALQHLFREGLFRPAAAAGLRPSLAHVHHLFQNLLETYCAEKLLSGPVPACIPA